MRFYPTPTLLACAGIWLGLGVVAAMAPGLVVVWQASGAAIAGVAIADRLRQRRRASPSIERKLSRNLPVGTWSKAVIEMRNTSSLPLRCEVHDLHPGSFEVEGQPATVDLQPNQWAHVRYRLQPPTRGTYQVPGTEIMMTSPWHLWRERRTVGTPQELRVYPNFSRIAHYTLLTTDNRQSQMGVKRRQRRGEGSDFHQLREYRVGDTLRQIDWKATSRLRKLISREFQDERDQQIMFLIDCGRRMRHAEVGRVHLDEALNAVLLVSYVSLRQGDAVGFMTMGGVRRWYAPRKGQHLVSSLLNATYDLQSTLEATDYRAAASELLARQRRRALVVVITNTHDEDQSDLEAAVKLLRRSHLVLVADMRESLLDEIESREVTSLKEALQFQATEDYLGRRRDNHERLMHHGARILNIRPDQLPIALVNQYFAIKREGAL